MKVQFGLIILLLALGSSVLRALDLDEAVELAVSSSPDVSSAAEEARDAASAIGSPFELDRARLTISASAVAAGTPAQNRQRYSARADLLIPVLPQAELSGSATAEGATSAAVAVEPFAPWSSYTAEDGAYRKALVRLGEEIVAAEAEAEKLALDFLVEKLTVEHAKRSAALSEDQYTAVMGAYELGEATIDDLRDAQQGVSVARRRYLSAQSVLISAEKSLALVLGPEAARERAKEGRAVEIEALSVDEILSRAYSRQVAVEGIDEGSATSAALARNRIDLETLKRQSRETWLWRPSVTFKGGVSFPEDMSSPEWSASVAMSFSPGDLNDDRIEDLASAIEDAVDAIDTETFALALDVESARQGVSIAREVLSAALLDRERASLVAQESTILYRQGERTEIELQDARLSLVDAEIAVFRAAADLVSAQNRYLVYFSGP